MHKTCVTLEGSTERVNRVALSKDGHLFASVIEQDEAKEKTLLFRLWDTQTGKILKTKQITKVGNIDHKTRLHFSPKNRLVYLKGYKHFDSVEDNFIEFWDLETDQLTLSACNADRGAIIKFSDNEEMAYVRNYWEHNICPTVTRLGGVRATQSTDSVVGSDDLQLTPQARKQAVKSDKFLIKGGFDNDKQYFSSYRILKYDQYLFLRGESVHDGNNIFIFNLQSQKGQIFTLPHSMMDFRPLSGFLSANSLSLGYVVMV